MPIAAVPDYLQGQDFNEASPGMRFGFYLKLWNPGGWTKVKERPLESAKSLGRNDKAVMQALLERQKELYQCLPHETQKYQRFATSIAPFTTGLGNEHPLENGFAFLNPYGLPYLPGSGVKGVLRQAARELAGGDWGDSHGWRDDKTYTLAADKETLALSCIDVLFGLEATGNSHHLRGALSFWDVMPQIRGDSLMVEIMTPHQGHYYQSSPAADSISPHDSGQPNPISFLTVPPGSGFTFHVVCDRAHLDRIAPELAQDSRWHHLLTAAFEHAFSWCGFGAKTAVGYGAMARDFAAETQAEAARAKHEAEAKLAALTPNLRAVEQFSQAMASRYEQLRGSKERQNTEYHQKAQKLAKDAREGTDWTQAEKRAAAEAITEWLPKVVERIDRDALKKLKLNDLRGTP